MRSLYIKVYKHTQTAFKFGLPVDGFAATAIVGEFSALEGR